MVNFGAVIQAFLLMNWSLMSIQPWLQLQNIKHNEANQWWWTLLSYHTSRSCLEKGVYRMKMPACGLASDHMHAPATLTQIMRDTLKSRTALSIFKVSLVKSLLTTSLSARVNYPQGFTEHASLTANGTTSGRKSELHIVFNFLRFCLNGHLSRKCFYRLVKQWIGCKKSSYS